MPAGETTPHLRYFPRHTFSWTSGTHIYATALLEYLNPHPDDYVRYSILRGIESPLIITREQEFVSNSWAAGGSRYLGTGPNGGRLVEYWFASHSELPGSGSSAQIHGYLVDNWSYVARNIVIHNKWATHFPPGVGQLFGFVPFMLVANGAVASLSAESITIGDIPWDPCTVVARLDLRSPQTTIRPGIGGMIVVERNGSASIMRVQDTLSTLPNSGNAHASGVSIPQALVTLGARCEGGQVQFFHDGNPVGTLAPVETFAGMLGRLMARSAGDGYLTMPLRRLMIVKRGLSNAEMMMAHAGMVAAEGGA
ncbi:MAG: hypothetical protein NZ518_02335 [Dehalococcoidia bacterium]|nr:hypothetical protein [Dehalococcoidia bacterium]